jgi:hypothetical protein
MRRVPDPVPEERWKLEPPDDGIRWAPIVRAAVIAIPMLAIGWELAFSPWPLTTTLRHYFAFPSCSFANAVGLGAAQVGAPGYWKHHDHGSDGHACQWLPQRVAG